MRLRNIGKNNIYRRVNRFGVNIYSQICPKKYHSNHQGQPRSQGVYGAVAIAKIFKGAEFPLSKHDIIEKYGDKEIEYHIGKMEKLKRDIIHDIPEQTFKQNNRIESICSS
ncbi:MAG: hypothetical protein MZU95_03985 [Desulfomicrobium escambiense]|nr:hypothetical protein [Desulfomicrobium escambiense]